MFVRGSNGCEIGHFVEKVVFNLHESFPKPKRVIKEPPYTVKEAGYAGFELTIDICFKNREEPKKVVFSYDLDLQPYKIQSNEFVISTPTEEFKRKCLKGGCVVIHPGDYKGREPYKNPPIPQVTDPKKLLKRPEETKANKTFTDLFGAPLKKPDSRTVQNASPNPAKLQASATRTSDKIPLLSGSGGKEKNEKSKHKHSPSKDGRDGKKPTDTRSDLPEKLKKDRTKDRERTEKKEKQSKRPLSPSSSSQPLTLPRNSTNLNAFPQVKTELGKTKPQSSASVPTSDLPFSKKSSKKDRKSEKERDRNEKKESRKKEPSSKEKFESSAKGNSSAQKDRGPLLTKDEREKCKTKSDALLESKSLLVEGGFKKHNEKEGAPKNKHKKREKTKDRDLSKEIKKDKQNKSSPVEPSPAKTKDSAVIKNEQAATKIHFSDKDSTDSDADSPPSIKQESENSLSDSIVQIPPPLMEKSLKKSRERTKTTDKEEKSRKRKANKKDEREVSDSPQPPKQPRKDLSKSPFQDRPTSSDSHNNNNFDVTNKLPNDTYINGLKDLKHKITTLKNNEDLQTIVRMIAATGCYEITKSSFDFDLVQLDRGTVQRLQEFFNGS